VIIRQFGSHCVAAVRGCLRAGPRGSAGCGGCHRGWSGGQGLADARALGRL